MILAENFDYVLIAPKIIIALIFLISGIKILQLNREYSLNKYYFMAMISWSVYVFMDALIWVIADISPAGYTAAEILRDIQMLGAVGIAFFLYNAQKIIEKGEKSLYNTRYFVELAIIIIVTVFLIIVDYVVVVDSSGEPIAKANLPVDRKTRTMPVITPLTAVLSITPVIIYIYSIFKQFRLGKEKITDAGLKRRIKLRGYGLSFVLFGILYFIAQNIFGWEGLAWILIGYVSWFVASILIWKSTQRK